MKRQRNMSFMQLGIRFGQTVNDRLVVAKHETPSLNWYPKVPEGVSQIHDLLNTGSSCYILRTIGCGLTVDCFLENASIGVPLIMWMIPVTHRPVNIQ